MTATFYVGDAIEVLIIEKVSGEWPDWALSLSSGTDMRSLLDALLEARRNRDSEWETDVRSQSRESLQ